MIEEQKNPENLDETHQTPDSSESANSNSQSESTVEESAATTATVDTEVVPEADTTAAETKTDLESATLTEVQSLEAVIATLQEDNAALKRQLEEQIQQAELTKAQHLRNAADFENFRKRTEKEKENVGYQAKRNTVNELLTVIDNFERARVQIKPQNDGEMAIHKSYQGVYRLLVDSLKRIGVSAMRPEGEAFDPNYHEAVMQEETDEHPEGTVVEQLQRGYMLGDRVLRHAMVKVAIPKTSSASEAEPTPEVLESETTTEANPE